MVNSRRYLGLVAGGATLLSAAPLWVIFSEVTWLIQCVVTVGLITATATLARSLRAPAWAQAVAMSGTLLLVLTWFYPSHGELLGLLPTPDTFASFGGLLRQSVEDMRGYGVPVPKRRALIFLTVLGVGAVAIVVDLVTVSLRRPALAGLPMLAIYSVPVAIYTDSVPPLPFVIGAAGFLWLLVTDNVERVRRFGRRFSGDGRTIDAWEPSPLAAAGRRLAVVGVLVAVAIPLTLPDLGGGLVDKLGAGGGNGSGNGSSGGTGPVDLFAELSDRLNQSGTEDLVKVTTTERAPYYLRFAVADEINSAGFGSRPPSGTSLARTMRDPRDEPAAGVVYRQYHASVEILDRFNMPMLPVYATPIKVSGVDSAWSYDGDAQVVFSQRGRSAGREYEFDYVRASYDPTALRRAQPLRGDSERRRRFTNVPEVPEVAKEVALLTRGEATDYDKVRAIYDSFSAERGFTYSLATKPGNSGSAIVDFLKNKTGFCEQYAAAMAWMVRTAGIPARVAFGFTNGTNRSGNTFTLTNRNLHAWTEVYFAGYGWVPFDATPAANVAGSVVSAWAPDTNRPEETHPSTDPTAAPGAVPGAEPTGAADDRQDRDPGGAGGPIPTPNSTNWPWWTLSSLAILLLAAPAVRRSALRRRRRTRQPAAQAVATDAGHSGAPGLRVVTGVGEAGMARADAHAAWDELIDTLVDFRIPVDPTETPRATASRLIRHADLDGGAAQATELLGQAEERARYARDPLRPAGLAAALGVIHRALAGRASRRERLSARLLPPSVLLHWRLAILDRGTAAVLTAGRWRDRLNPRRLAGSHSSRS